MPLHRTSHSTLFAGAYYSACGASVLATHRGSERDIGHKRKTTTDSENALLVFALALWCVRNPPSPKTMPSRAPKRPARNHSAGSEHPKASLAGLRLAGASGAPTPPAGAPPKARWVIVSDGCRWNQQFTCLKSRRGLLDSLDLVTVRRR